VLEKHVSFVDCPGHEVLMTTMINGASMMNAAILLIDSTVQCPQPQTLEHLVALEIMNLKNIIIVQNKIDLVTREQAFASREQIKKFVSGTCAESAPIIPVCAQLGHNINTVVKCIAEIPEPPSLKDAPLIMNVARSFDVNRPGTLPKDLVGGVIGGTIVQGKVRIGDDVVIVPGLFSKSKEKSYPLYAKISSIKSEKNSLDEAKCGGLVALMSDLDSSLCRADGLLGMTVVEKDHENVVTTTMSVYVECSFLRNYIGSQSREKVVSLEDGEEVQLNIGTGCTNANFIKAKSSKPMFFFETKKPVAYNPNDVRVTISRKVGGKWRLMGWGGTKRDAPNVPPNYDVDYKSLVDTFYSQYNSVDAVEKLSMPPLTVSLQAKRSIFNSFTSVCSRLQRSVSEVQNFICTELGTEGSISCGGGLILKGKFRSNVYESTVKKYVKNFVMCKACKKFDTSLVKENRLTFLECHKCQSKYTVSK
jgi:translation initiation factor 2 subunit 3